MRATKLQKCRTVPPMLSEHLCLKPMRNPSGAKQDCLSFQKLFQSSVTVFNMFLLRRGHSPHIFQTPHCYQIQFHGQLLAPSRSAVFRVHNAALSAQIPRCLIITSAFRLFLKTLVQLKVRAIKPVPQTEYDRFCTKLHAHYCFSWLENEPNMHLPYRRRI